LPGSGGYGARGRQILVLGYDHGIVVKGVAPDGDVFGLAQSNLFHVPSVVTGFH